MNCKHEVLLQCLIGHLITEHPLPWRIESDSILEVRDADDGLVVTCASEFEARDFVALSQKERRSRPESKGIFRELHHPQS